MKPVTIRIPDLAVTVRLSVPAQTFEMVDGEPEPDLIVNSQPLHFAFRWPWGVQTLGVSARFFIRANFRNWRLHRILFSLNNGELYLKPSRFFTRKNLAYILERLRSAASTSCSGNCSG